MGWGGGQNSLLMHAPFDPSENMAASGGGGGGGLASFPYVPLYETLNVSSETLV